MQKFTTLTGVAAPLPMINVDTDAIIPKQFLKTIKRTGLGKNLFHELRYDEQGNEKPDFILNKPAYRKAQILVAGENFGCGSSREHAPWALMDFGIRCVISTSFADIFNNNCFQNGLLPVVLKPNEVRQLMDEAKGGNHLVTVDLEDQKVVTPSGAVFHCVRRSVLPAAGLLAGLGLWRVGAKASNTFWRWASVRRPRSCSSWLRRKLHHWALGGRERVSSRALTSGRRSAVASAYQSRWLTAKLSIIWMRSPSGPK